LQSLNFQQQDKVLAYYTREAWHKAMNNRTVENMKNYLALQHFWTERATMTSRLFEKTMLHYPQYNYAVTHPHNDVGVKLSDSMTEKNEAAVIRALSKNHGILYFYRGDNAFDRKESPIIADFAQTHGLKIIPVSVDGVIDATFPDSRIDKGQAENLNIRFFPAVMLVNPETRAVKPVSYGLVTQDALSRQFYLAATNFERGGL